MSEMKSHVILATFPDEEAASAAMEELLQARKDAKLDFDESAVITVDADGTIHVKDAADFSTGRGAGGGAIVGGIIGLLAGPAGAVIGAGAGAAVGGLLARGDEGFSDEALEALGEKLSADSSAIVAVVPDVWAVEFAKEAGAHSRDVSTQVLDQTLVARLQGEGSSDSGEETVA
jgi:uncharacterized membrane protein